MLFLNDYNEIRPFVHLFENLFLAQHGTTLGYMQKNNEYIPVLDEYEYSDEEKNIFLDIQEGAIEFVKEFNRVYGGLELNNEVFKLNMLKLGLNPSKEDIKLFKNIPYVETEKLKLITSNNIVYYLFHLQKLKEDFFLSGWKIGFLKDIFKLNLPYYKLYIYMKGIK